MTSDTSGSTSRSLARSLIVAFVLALVTGAVVQQVALVYNAGEIESSVPPVPAVMFLGGLALLNPVLTRLRPHWRLTRGELLVICSVLAISTAMSGRFLLRAMFGFLTTPHYYQNLQPIAETLPSWSAPSAPSVITGFYESSADGSVPWGEWLAPLGFWTAYSLVSWAGAFCTVELFRRRWTTEEHLRYPLLYLPVELADSAGGGKLTFVRDALMWAGSSLGFLYALPVVISPLWPGVPDWKVTLCPAAGVPDPSRPRRPTCPPT